MKILIVLRIDVAIIVDFGLLKVKRNIHES